MFTPVAPDHWKIEPEWQVSIKPSENVVTPLSPPKSRTGSILEFSIFSSGDFFENEDVNALVQEIHCRLIGPVISKSRCFETEYIRQFEIGCFMIRVEEELGACKKTITMRFTTVSTDASDNGQGTTGPP